MKWISLIFLVVGIIIGMYAESYAERIVFFRNEEKRMHVELGTDITIYKMMELNKYSSAISCIKVPLAANVRTYQYYKSHFPQFGVNNPELQQLVKQAIEIVPGAEGDVWPIPDVSTIMPLSTNNTPINDATNASGTSTPH